MPVQKTKILHVYPVYLSIHRKISFLRKSIVTGCHHNILALPISIVLNFLNIL